MKKQQATKKRQTVTGVKRSAKTEKNEQIILICPVCKLQHTFAKPQKGAVISFTCHIETENPETKVKEVTGCNTPLKFAF